MTNVLVQKTSEIYLLSHQHGEKITVKVEAGRITCYRHLGVGEVVDFRFIASQASRMHALGELFVAASELVRSVGEENLNG